VSDLIPFAGSTGGLSLVSHHFRSTEGLRHCVAYRRMLDKAIFSSKYKQKPSFDSVLRVDWPLIWRGLCFVCNAAAQLCWALNLSDPSNTGHGAMSYRQLRFIDSFHLNCGACLAWLLRVQSRWVFPDRGSRSRRWRSTSLRCKDPRKKLIICKSESCPPYQGDACNS